MKKLDLKGQRFGRLLVLSPAANKGGRTRWLCLCDCGAYTIAGTADLRSGDTKSCGCKHRDNALVNVHKLSKHNMSRTRLYRIWDGIKRRTKPDAWKAPRYGPRGIRMCDEWRSDFIVFEEWAISHGYNDTLQIDRIDNDGNYCPENCRWVTQKDNSNNRSTCTYVEFRGERHSLSEWSGLTGIPYWTLQKRILKYKWSLERAFTEPVKSGGLNQDVGVLSPPTPRP